MPTRSSKAIRTSGGSANRLRIFLLAIVSMLVTGCATGPTVTANYDRGADFHAYHTFGFVEKLGTDVAGYESLITQSLKAATRNQMETRGYAFVETGADLVINFNAKLSQETRINQMPAPMPMYYGYRTGFYGAWGGYQETTVSQYTQGTLNIDIVDAKRRQLVWEGIAVGRVTEKQAQNRDAALTAAVAEIFAKYPFSASN